MCSIDLTKWGLSDLEYHSLPFDDEDEDSIYVDKNGDVKNIPLGLTNNESLTDFERERAKRVLLQERVSRMDRDITSIKNGQTNIQVNQDNIKDDLLRSQQNLRDDINNSLQALTEMVTAIAQNKATKTLSRTPDTPASMCSIESLNLPIRDYTWEGRKMVTCSVTFKVGSKVYWKYGNDLIKDVTILEVIPSTMNRDCPVYYFEFGHAEKEVVRHDQLYIPEDSAPTMSSDGIIDATKELLPVAAQLHMSVMKEKKPHLMKLYNAMNNEKFKLDTFRTSIDSLALSDDKLMTLKQVYNYNSIVMGALAASKGMLHMPTLNELSPVLSIKDIMTPPDDYPMKPQAMAFLANFAQAIQHLVLKPEFSKNAPIAKRHINTVRFTKDGLEALYYLFCKRIPFLGAIDFDSYAVIKATVVDDGMQLSDFWSQVQEAQMQLELSPGTSSPNALLKQILDQLFKTNLAPLITKIRHDLNNFLRKNPNGPAYKEETVESIMEYLLEGQSVTTIRLLEGTDPTSESRLNVPAGYRDALVQHKKHSNFSKPHYAAMKHEDTVDEPIISHDHIEEDDASVQEYTEEDKALVDELIKPVFARLQIEGDEEANERIWNDLFFSAMRGVRENRSCEACHKTDHFTDGCWARGPEFQDPALRRRVQQVNAKYGDKPINPPKPRTPPTASFGLKHKSMALQKSNVTKTNEIKSLQYRTINQKEDIEQILDELSQDLEQAVANDDLEFTPQLAVLNIQDETNKDSSGESLADAMLVADYSVYNEQVNC
jgi:hypothetical protein